MIHCAISSRTKDNFYRFVAQQILIKASYYFCFRKPTTTQHLDSDHLRQTAYHIEKKTQYSSKVRYVLSHIFFADFGENKRTRRRRCVRGEHTAILGYVILFILFESLRAFKFKEIKTSLILISQQMGSHKKYSKISLQKREKLVNLVMNQQSSIAKAARKLMIKVSTAKLIIRRYKQKGTFFAKKMPNYSRKNLKTVEEDLSVTDQNIENKTQKTDSFQVLIPQPIRFTECKSSEELQEDNNLVQYPKVLLFYLGM